MTASTGIVYFGGNRIPSPYTVEFYHNVLSVNGMILPPLPTPVRALTPSESTKTAVRDQVWRILRAGEAKGVSDTQNLGTIRDSIQANPAIESVRLEQSAIVVKYRDDPYPTEFWLPDERSKHPPTADEQDTSRSMRLQRIKRALDRGFLVYIGRNVQSFLPTGEGRRLDNALQSQQRKSTLSPDQRQILDSMTPTLQEEVKHPITLMPAR